MLIDEQYIKDGIVYNMDNYSLKDGDRIMITGSDEVCTIGKECNVDKSGKCIINFINLEFWSNEFVLVDRINKYNYWHYYYSNSSIWKLLQDYRQINNNNHIHICKEQQIQGIKNRIENIVEYGLIDYIYCKYVKTKDLYYNLDYKSYEKECNELNISQYYYCDIEDNKLVPFNSKEEYYEYIIKRKDS